MLFPSPARPPLATYRYPIARQARAGCPTPLRFLVSQNRKIGIFIFVLFCYPHSMGGQSHAANPTWRCLCHGHDRLFAGHRTPPTQHSLSGRLLSAFRPRPRDRQPMRWMRFSRACSLGGKDCLAYPTPLSKTAERVFRGRARDRTGDRTSQQKSVQIPASSSARSGRLSQNGRTACLHWGDGEIPPPCHEGHRLCPCPNMELVKALVHDARSVPTNQRGCHRLVPLS